MPALTLLIILIAQFQQIYDNQFSLIFHPSRTYIYIKSVVHILVTSHLKAFENIYCVYFYIHNENA